MIHFIHSNFQIYRENEATDWWCLWLIAFQNARSFESQCGYTIAYLSSPPMISLTVGHHSPFTSVYRIWKVSKRTYFEMMHAMKNSYNSS